MKPKFPNDVRASLRVHLLISHVDPIDEARRRLN